MSYAVNPEGKTWSGLDKSCSSFEDPSAFKVL
jgi:hypothetical protein